MKRFSVFIATIMMVSAMQAAEKLDLKAITSGEFCCLLCYRYQPY